MAFIMSLMMLLTAVPVNGLTAWAADDKATVNLDTATKAKAIDINADSNGITVFDTEIKGTIEVKVSVTDMLSSVIGKVDKVVGFGAGGAFVTREAADSVPIEFKLPSGLKVDSITPINNSKILVASELGQENAFIKASTITDNTAIGYINFAGGPDASVLQLDTLSQYYKADKTDGKGNIGFIVKYSGTVPAGTKVSEYKASISGTDKSFRFGRWVRTSVAFSPSSVQRELLNAVKPNKFPLNGNPLEGDLLVRKSGEEDYNTESGKAFPVRPGQKLDIQALLDVSPVQKQMEDIEKDKLAGLSAEELVEARKTMLLKDTESSFVTTFAVPKGLAFPKEVTAYKLTSQKNGAKTAKFVLENPVVTDTQVTLTMKFEGDKITTYADLYEAIHDNTLPQLKLDVSGVAVANDAQGKLKLTGEVKGSMSSLATLSGNSFYPEITWASAKQKADGADAENPNNLDQISLTLLVDGAPNAEIFGDILVAKYGSKDFDTEHDAFFPVKAGDKLTYKATLDVSGIQEQMKKVEELKAKGKEGEELTAFLNSIKLKDTESKFTVTIQYDEGLEFPTDDKKYSFAGSSAFKLNTVEVNPQTGRVTLTIELVDGDAKTSYAALSKAIQQDTEKILTLTVEGVEVAEDVLENQLLTTVGTVKGSMKANAYTGDDPSNAQPFNFDWVAKQDTTIPDEGGNSKDGTDFKLKDNNPYGTIQLTVETLKVQEAPTQYLPTDILVQRDGDTEFDTEHKAVYPVNRGDLLNYQAIVDVSSIKKQMGEIEEQYHKLSPADQQAISLSDTESSFHVNVIIDQGLVFPKDRAAYELKTGNEESFVIAGVPTVKNNKLHIDMKLKDAEGIKTYAELARRIKEATADILTLNIKGVKVKEAPEAAGQLTVKATLDGSMSSTAKFGNNVIPFRFSWRGVQADGINSELLKEDGTDWILRDKSDDEKRWIWLTVAVRDTTGILNIKKVVVGKDGEEQNNRDEFPVRVWLDALPAGEAGQEPLIASQFNTLPWTNAGNYPKQNGENYYRYYTDLSIPANDIISIAGIPDGTGYYVEELTSNTNMPRGYVEDYAGLGTAGSITGNGAVTALIVNYREDAEQSIIIKKSWQKDDEKKRPASVKVKLVPHIGSADGEVVEELVHEYELTKQDGWYKVITGNKLFATMSDASKSDARKQAEALIVGTKSNAASKANAQHLKGLTPSDALVDENGKLLDGDIVNDIVEGIKDFFKKIFGIEDQIVWTVEEIKVPAGYESKVSDSIETKKGLSFEITNTGTKTDTPDKPDDPKTPDKPNNSGGSSSGGGSSSSGGHRHNGGSTVPAGPGLNPVPVTPEPAAPAAPTTGRSGSLPKTGETAALLGELLAVLALMAGAWALLGGKRKEQ